MEEKRDHAWIRTSPYDYGVQPSPGTHLVEKRKGSNLCQPSKRRYGLVCARASKKRSENRQFEPTHPGYLAPAQAMSLSRTNFRLDVARRIRETTMRSKLKKEKRNDDRSSTPKNTEVRLN
jgi:hypothetical protein